MSIQAITKQTSWLRWQAPKTNSDWFVIHCRTFKNWESEASYQPWYFGFKYPYNFNCHCHCGSPCNLSCLTECCVGQGPVVFVTVQVRVPALRWGLGFLRWRRREAALAPAAAGSCHETRARSFYVSGGRWMSSVGRTRASGWGNAENMRKWLGNISMTLWQSLFSHILEQALRSSYISC